MEHVLNNPVWQALNSGNSSLANGTGGVRYFDQEVSPFAGFEVNTDENFQILYDAMPVKRPVLFVSPGETEIPEMWKVIRTIRGYQMVCDGDVELPEITAQIIDLSKAHVPQMLELTKLTNPGPFAERTIEFGHYTGIFDDDKLVAMTGQRLHPFNYAEVSAVCTHPDHLGKGYARALLNYHIKRIKAADETPFLHVRNDNERAIKVYEDMGFKKRIEVVFYVMVKK